MKTHTKRRIRRTLYLLFVVALAGSYTSWCLLHPLPLLSPTPSSRQFQSTPLASTLSWPAAGQSAAGILGTDIIETHGTQTPVPTASTAKVITALTVLSKKPLTQGQQGPVITLTDSDVALYKNYAAQDGSLVPVVAGEQISEYQMLQAIMLPSANNIADSMAIWAFGSLAAYSDAANAYVAENNLSNTHVGVDASGFSPTTTSTAQDLVRIGELAMNTPVLAEIVGQSVATGIPQTSSIKNVNSLLGINNIVGIKTGNTDQAGGVFMSASRIKINDKPVTIVTAVAGSPTLFIALKDSLALIQSAQINFTTATIVKSGEEIARYAVPWGGSVSAVASNDLSVRGWKSSKTIAFAELADIDATKASAGQSAGTISVPASAFSAKQAVPATLTRNISQPSVWWRLSHPSQ